jgi:dephospho-CoA kinase
MKADRKTDRNPGNYRHIIGLTGGIGTGKTTVSDYLANTYQLPVLDADVYAREAVQPGSPVLDEVGERYGSGILLPDGTLDRRRLGDIIFSSASERLWLEQRIHPFVRDRLETGIEKICQSPHPKVSTNQAPTVVLVIPLLFEARMTDLVTEVWVVYCPRSQQIERLMERDQLMLEQVQARLNSQMDIEKKVARADVVLDNSSTPAALFKQVDQAIACIS